ncbi:hypothetical protein KCP75_07690 [Salmonella enterica subsp. enterica]|nr:hypothetical protein KCP75_07690 [Salmonella enterica subsp. enterica]
MIQQTAILALSGIQHIAQGKGALPTGLSISRIKSVVQDVSGSTKLNERACSGKTGVSGRLCRRGWES